MPDEGVGFPRTGNTGACELPDLSAGTRSAGFLQEQQVLLVAGPSKSQLLSIFISSCLLSSSLSFLCQIVYDFTTSVYVHVCVGVYIYIDIFIGT